MFNPIIFTNIYLLVDGVVYSSSEAFVVFCKATQFAKLAGRQTGGDGIGQDPFILTLPSGIVIRYTGEMGLNPDGSSNEEKGTQPDIFLSAETPNERLEQLKEYIISQKNN